MIRTRWFLLVLPALIALVWCLPLWAETTLDAETMKAALRTATIEEDGFIDKVVKKVRDGDLPSGLVDTTFEWARKKPKHRFQYFKKGLVTRAAERGITL